jgi:hypothetical protein
MPDPSSPHDPVRRRVLRALGLAGLTSLGAPALAMGQAKADSGRGPMPPVKVKVAGSATGTPIGAAGAPKPPEISEDARTLAEIVKRRYGQYLTPEQLEGVTKQIDSALQGGKTLRAAKLENGDEPDFAFHA